MLDGNATGLRRFLILGEGGRLKMVVVEFVLRPTRKGLKTVCLIIVSVVFKTILCPKLLLKKKLFIVV